MAYYVAARVVGTVALKSYVRLVLDAPEIASEMRPGQFVMLRVGEEHLLPRPFSIAQADGSTISIVFQNVGTGTERLAYLRPGDVVRVLGPLGRGFDEDGGDRPVLVAGGRGIAPFFELSRRLADRAPLLFYGGRTGEQIVEIEHFRRYCRDVVITTEDGSLGRKGLLTEPLAEHLAREPASVLYACGPHKLLHRIAEIAPAGTRAELSMEARMGCGFGICLGCVIPAGASGYKRVCVEGPVFLSTEIRWADLK